MDYDANLVQFCPPAYVAQARAEDWSDEGSRNVVEDAWTDSSMSQECLNALLAYFVPKVGPDTNNDQLDIWLSYLNAYQGPIEGNFRQDLVNALLSIPHGTVNPYFYYGALGGLKLDLRDQLSKTVPINWNFHDLDGPEAETWYYTMYLAHMDTPGAYTALAKKIEATESGNEVYRYLSSLSGLKTDEALKIIKTYANDRRAFYLRDVSEPAELRMVVKGLIERNSN